MRNDDQWFRVGDKVMRVGSHRPDGNLLTNYTGGIPQYGQIYCVEDFWEGPQFNVVMLVGFGGWRIDPWGRKVGWCATAFRKIDEIKLCIEAANKIKKPVEALT